MSNLFDSLKNSINNLRNKQKGDVSEESNDQSMEDSDAPQSKPKVDENGSINYVDEGSDKDQGNRVKTNSVMLVAGAAGACVLTAVLASALFPSTPASDPPLNSASLATHGNNAGNDPTKGIPDKYSDIAKYSSNKNNNNTAQQKKPVENIKPQNNIPSTSSYISNYNNRNTQAQQPPTPAVQQLSPEEKAAQEEAKRVKDAENKALQSAISFAVAVNRGGNVGGAANAGAQGAQKVVSTSYSITDVPGEGASFALQAGSVIQATLITGITTDVEGSSVVAQVRQNIYDTQTGEHLLIPQGSRLIGKAGSAGGRGNPRVKIAFTRLIYPDGHDIQLPNEQAIDGVGYTGLKDQYTEHSGKLYGTAFVTALLAAAAQSATGNSSGSDDRSPGEEAVSGAVADVLDSAKSLIDRQSSVQPTATIRPGMEFSVFITQDLFLAEYDED